MQDTISRYVGAMPSGAGGAQLMAVLSALGDRLSSQVQGDAALVIKAGSSALAKTGAAAVSVVVSGVLRSIAAATDMAALSGTTSQNFFNVYCFYIDSGGTLTSAMGAQGATLATVKFPPMPVGKAMVGYVTVNPTAAAFIGGTTALDAANTNVVYVNVRGACDPTVIL